MPYKSKEDRHNHTLKYRREHRERVNELNRARYNADKETANARRRELYIEHRDYVSEYRRQQRILKPDEHYKWSRNYQLKYPEKGRREIE